jgi:hypothetical protein
MDGRDRWRVRLPLRAVGNSEPVPEDAGRTIEVFNWIERTLVRPQRWLTRKTIIGGDLKLDELIERLDHSYGCQKTLRPESVQVLINRERRIFQARANSLNGVQEHWLCEVKLMLQKFIWVLGLDPPRA